MTTKIKHNIYTEKLMEHYTSGCPYTVWYAVNIRYEDGFTDTDACIGSTDLCEAAMMALRTDGGFIAVLNEADAYCYDEIDRDDLIDLVLDTDDDGYYTECIDGALEAVYNATDGDGPVDLILRSICKRENRMDIWDDEDDLPTIVDRLIDECDIRITRV